MDAAAISLTRENNIPIIVFLPLEQGNFAKVLAGEGKNTIHPPTKITETTLLPRTHQTHGCALATSIRNSVHCARAALPLNLLDTIQIEAYGPCCPSSRSVMSPRQKHAC